MASIRTGDFDRKIYTESREIASKSKVRINLMGETEEEEEEEEEKGSQSGAKGSSKGETSLEYVKRTAKLFERTKGSVEPETINNGFGGKLVEDHFGGFADRNRRESDRETGNGNPTSDIVDGEANKKPSYLGVSCSNSGYRNVINYDSKLREGFHSANSQRESLVLCSNRLRESSPMRTDLEFRYRNGGDDPTRSAKTTATATAGVTTTTTTTTTEREEIVSANGFDEAKKFVNISTSTVTISTFRSRKPDAGEPETGKELNSSAKEADSISIRFRKDRIQNGKPETPNRRGYSNLGFSPKILKSPEKNCNSFLKSINSFENSFKKAETSGRHSGYAKTDQTIRDSIQQRIERLYGPGALAQGFYMQRSNSRTGFADKTEEPGTERIVEIVNRTSQPSPRPKPDSIPPEREVAAVEPSSTSATTNESQREEKNGLYFLKLLKRETDRLESLAALAETELENGENLSEEINGKLRAAAGKARLLVSQKLHQFEGLCRKNMNEKPSDPFPTTSEDLAGFWDMVMLQIVQVHGVFEELEELKKNNWKMPAKKEISNSSGNVNGQSQPAKNIAKKSVSNADKTSQKSEAAKKAREESRRKMLEDKRKKMRELKEKKFVEGEGEIEIFAK